MIIRSDESGFWPLAVVSILTYFKSFMRKLVIVFKTWECMPCKINQNDVYRCLENNEEIVK